MRELPFYDVIAASNCILKPAQEPFTYFVILRIMYTGHLHISEHKIQKAKWRLHSLQQDLEWHLNAVTSRFELCASLTGAQLARPLERELTLAIQQLTLWSESKTVLTWIQSESCRYKVFVGTRVAEIQELTSPRAWRYVKSKDNPADDITHGKPLWQLALG